MVHGVAGGVVRGRGRVAAGALLGVWMTGAYAASAPAAWSLTAEAWAVPRQAETILAMAPVAAAVRALLADPQSQLILTHPAGEEGGLWGSELRDWLVSLGIEPQRIRLQAAAASATQLNLSISTAVAGRAKP